MPRTLIGVGLTLLTVGLIWLIVERVGIGQLPGDFQFRFGKTKVYIPLLSCIVISIILSLIFRFFRRS